MSKTVYVILGAILLSGVSFFGGWLAKGTVTDLSRGIDSRNGSESLTFLKDDAYKIGKERCYFALEQSGIITGNRWYATEAGQGVLYSLGDFGCDPSGHGNLPTDASCIQDIDRTFASWLSKRNL